MAVPESPTITEFYTPIPNPNQGREAFNTNWQSYLDSCNTTVADMNVAVQYVEDTANLAEGFANTAETAAATSSATSNNAGAWADQTGAKAPPYSVTHNGTAWILDNAIADITASEPGVSGDWTEAPGGGFTNPMTTAGDIIVGGASGAATRLGLGDPLQNIRVNAAGTALEFADPAGGDTGSSTTWVNLGTITGTDSVEIDLDNGANAFFYVTFGDAGGTVTFTVANAPDDFSFQLSIIRGGIKSVSWPSGWSWMNNQTPTFKSGADEYDKIVIENDAYFTGSNATMIPIASQDIP